MKVKYLVPLFAAMALIAACGGSSTGTTESLNSASDVPSLDAQNYDYSYTQPSSNLSKSLSISKANKPGEVGGFSRSGCEANSLKKQVIRNSKLPDMIRCYASFIESVTGTEMTEAWRVFAISNFPEGQGPGESSFVVRMRKSPGGGGIDMDSCMGGSKETELRTVANPGGGCTITSKNISNSWGDNQMTITLTGACNSTTYDTATFAMDFNDNYGYGSATLGANRADSFNTLSGAMYGTYGGNAFTGKAYSKFGETYGSSKYNSVGTYPAQSISVMCGGNSYCTDYFAGLGFAADDYACFSETAPGSGIWVPEAAVEQKCTFDQTGVESFQVATTSNTQAFTVIDHSTVENSFYDDVYDHDLAALVQPTITYTDEWLCNANDAEPLDISVKLAAGTDAQRAAFAVCVAKDSEMNDFTNADSCQKMEDANRSENQD